MKDSDSTRAIWARGRWILLACLVLTAACSGGGTPADPAVSPDSQNCTGSCASTATFLTVADVQSVIARAVAEAQARNVNATIAVTDRVGNVLAVFQMTGAPLSVTVGTTPIGIPVTGGLEGVNIIPSTLAAIAKAVTGSYLSSEGNAFSTRTASQIVQQHFNPGETLTPSGPLSGVQFSSLPCSDLVSRFNGTGPSVGPNRSPLGLSADPGGFPLYKGGTPVGGVGVSVDGVYTLDPNILDTDQDVDEAIAFAATFGLAPPVERRADRLTADGKTFRYSDAVATNLLASTSAPPAFATIATTGSLQSVLGYTNGVIQQGTAFGQPASGIRPDVLDYPGLDAFVLVDNANVERFRPRAGTEPAGALTTTEVQAILASALTTANRARAQIRAPQGTPARVTISVVDTNGVILGIARTRDAPVFGTDVSLQKARTAMFFSSPIAGAAISGVPNAAYLNGGLTVLNTVPLGNYVTATQSLLGLPNALNDGQFAFTSRAIGAIARPFMPDGVDGNPSGPLAKPAGQWSVFSTGIQLDLVYNTLVAHVGFVLNVVPTDVGTNCTGLGGLDVGFAAGTPIPQVANGLQIFPGSAPVYRGMQLVGGVGVSGDGVDQDDMIAFLGIQNAANSLGGFGQAPAPMRADQLAPGGPFLRYVGCPQSPFIDSTTQEPCNGN